MTIPSDQKRNITLTAEGNALEHAGRFGADTAIIFTKCWIDGNFNALIRMEGPERAAEFAFHLSDRVVAGLRKETDPLKAISCAPPADGEKKPRAFFTPWRTGYAWGIFHGTLTMWWVPWVIAKAFK